MHVFRNSIDNGSFPEKIKIAKVTPVLLPRFSKILKRIMYNRSYSYFDQNKILYGKQFGFRDHHSNDLALVELVDSIFDSFNEKNIQ